MESGSWKATSAGAVQLATDGIKPLIAQPEVVGGEKTDFNDVLLHGGSEKVKAQFYPQYSIDSKTNIPLDAKLISIKYQNDKMLKSVLSIDKGDQKQPSFI